MPLKAAVLDDITLSITPAGVNRVSLLLYRASNKIDWNTPGQMVRVAIRNTVMVDPSPLSHVDVAIECAGRPARLTGMARVKTFDFYRKLLFGGLSLDLLTASYPGREIERHEVLQELSRELDRDNVRVVRFDIQPETCARLESYHDEYRERGFTKTYAGFRSNPFRGEGAGCAAYAISFLRVAGVMDDELKGEWTRHLSVPTRLITTSERRADTGFWGFLFGKDESWAKPGEPSEELTVFDPEKIFDWVDLKGLQEYAPIQNARASATGDYWQLAW